MLNGMSHRQLSSQSSFSIIQQPVQFTVAAFAVDITWNEFPPETWIRGRCPRKALIPGVDSVDSHVKVTGLLVKFVLKCTKEPHSRNVTIILSFFYVLFEIDTITNHLIFSRELLYLAKNYALIYTRLFENSKASIIRSIITWSEMRQVTQAIKVCYPLI